LVQLFLSIVSETRWSRIPELREENVMGAPILNESQYADPHLARAVEGRYVGILVKSASQKWERMQGPRKSASCSVCLETPGGNFEYFFNIQEAGNRSHASRRPVFK